METKKDVVLFILRAKIKKRTTAKKFLDWLSSWGMIILGFAIVCFSLTIILLHIVN